MPRIMNRAQSGANFNVASRPKIAVSFSGCLKSVAELLRDWWLVTPTDRPFSLARTILICVLHWYMRENRNRETELLKAATKSIIRIRPSRVTHCFFFRKKISPRLMEIVTPDYMLTERVFKLNSGGRGGHGVTSRSKS